MARAGGSTQRRKGSDSSVGNELVGAAASGDTALAKALIDQGADVNAMGNCAAFARKGYKLRPLIAAASCGHVSMMRLLLKSGADPSLTCTEGMTALDEVRVLEISSPKAAERMARLLEQAAARPSASVSCVIPPPDLRSASKRTRYQKALKRLEQCAGGVPKPIFTRAGPLPGGVGKEEEAARSLVEQHLSEFLEKDAYLFFTRDLLARRGPLVALLPTKDPYAVIAAIGTSGANDGVANSQVIDWLKRLAEDEHVRVTGIGQDFIEGCFTRPLHNPSRLARRIAEICPDARGGEASRRRQSAYLQKTRRLLLWWD